jgi:glycerol transport system substrate-binding protein
VAGLVVCAVAIVTVGTTVALADQYEDAVQKWADYFEDSVLTRAERVEQLTWFMETAKPFRGMSIKSVAEDLNVHRFEQTTLTKAFEEITGIQVSHDLIGEDSCVERLQTQMATGQRIYDIYVNDADLIGTHLRKDSCLNLTEYMAGEGKAYTDPWLDLDDFLQPEFGQDYEGNQLQLNDQQFPALYWFRKDWFDNPKYKAMFREKYGYELGIPMNWRAYDDIANFWTNDVQYIDGVRIFGHIEGAKKAPILSVRFTDAWFSIAGMGDKGLPNGLPVDEWGIRVNEDGNPVGCSVQRGGALNSPAAVYAVQTYADWVTKYGPPYGKGVDLFDIMTTAASGIIAQQIWQYGGVAGGPAYWDPANPCTDDEGNPLWRMAPIPHGKYWEEGMKVGYQDAGAWTIPPVTKGNFRAASWMWAQFCVSKTVCLKKFMEGKCPIRKSTIFSPWAEEMEAKQAFGGILSFYRSPDVYVYTDTGLNVPDYPLLAEQWWRILPKAWTGQATAQEACDELADLCDALMKRLFLPTKTPMIAEAKPYCYWINQPGAPKPKIFNEPNPVTMDYDELIEMWRRGETPAPEFFMGWQGVEKEYRPCEEWDPTK